MFLLSLVVHHAEPFLGSLISGLIFVPLIWLMEWKVDRWSH
jgi:hypothetical protein